MNEPRDPILDADLDAYVDDQLDTPRRIEVEAYLSAHPNVAARVMTDLRMRDELRLALASATGMPRPATGDVARRLERGLARGWLFGKVQRVAAVGLFVAAGWFAHDVAGPLTVTQSVASTPSPSYVGDAIQAHRTSLVRASMASQPAIRTFDPAEIRAATAIVLPTLPKGWKVRDVQVYPSQFGPSVEMALLSEDQGGLSLFAVRPGSFNVIPPTVASTAEATAAYFQIGEVAYVLVGQPGTEHLDRIAEKLSASLY